MSYRMHPAERIEHGVGKGELMDRLKALCPGLAILSEAEELRTYDCDGLSAYQVMPWLVVLPETVEQVQGILSACHRLGVPVVARGAGTGLSGGALPVDNGVLLSLARFQRILAIDPHNRIARVQPGVRNLAVSQAAEPYGLYFAPDPSSQIACTVGGNLAENSGGVHCLKYGLTVHNVLSAKIVLIDGELVQLGSEALDAPGYDLMALITGSEGLLGVIVELSLRLLPRPEAAGVLLAAFPSVESAAQAVAAIIGAGLIPAGLELMDNLSIRAAESFVQAGYPVEAGAILLCEMDGLSEQVEADLQAASRIMSQCGALELRRSRDEAERKRFWAGRKAAFPAVGRISPDYYCMDGTIPRHRLAEVLGAILRLSEKYGLRVANVFHAGDGNLHPLILYDGSQSGQLEGAEAFGAEILALCVAAGGTITGEHGVGMEKINQMCLQFGEGEREQFLRLKAAFDPRGLLNPGKAIPSLHRCAEFGAMHVHGAALPHAELERF